MRRSCVIRCSPRWAVHSASTWATIAREVSTLRAPGGCRVKVGGQTLFTCVDGPEFDGHLIDWDTVMARQRIYHKEEKCSLNRYVEEAQRS